MDDGYISKEEMERLLQESQKRGDSSYNPLEEDQGVEIQYFSQEEMEQALRATQPEQVDEIGGIQAPPPPWYKEYLEKYLGSRSDPAPEGAATPPVEQPFQPKMGQPVQPPVQPPVPPPVPPPSEQRPPISQLTEGNEADDERYARLNPYADDRPASPPPVAAEQRPWYDLPELPSPPRVGSPEYDSLNNPPVEPPEIQLQENEEGWEDPYRGRIPKEPRPPIPQRMPGYPADDRPRQSMRELPSPPQPGQYPIGDAWAAAEAETPLAKDDMGMAWAADEERKTGRLPKPESVPTINDRLGGDLPKVREPTKSEKEFFDRTGIPGYAAEDNMVVLNPNREDRINYDAIKQNEQARILMRMGRVPSPDFDLTDAQKQSFVGTEYAFDRQAQKDTIAARILTNDDSALDVTLEQGTWVQYNLAPAFEEPTERPLSGPLYQRFREPKLAPTFSDMADRDDAEDVEAGQRLGRPRPDWEAIDKGYADLRKPERKLTQPNYEADADVVRSSGRLVSDLYDNISRARAGFDHTSTDQALKQARRMSLGQTASSVGQGLGDAFSHYIVGTLARAYMGTDTSTKKRSFVNSMGGVEQEAGHNLAVRLIEREKARTKRRNEERAKQNRPPISWVPFITRDDVQNFGKNAGYSGAVALTAAAAGVPVAAFSPAGGFVVAGTTAFFVANRSASNDAAHALRDSIDESRAKSGLKPMTDAQYKVIGKRFEKYIRNQGLWEAVPETASNLIGFGILSAGSKSFIGKMFGKDILTRFMTKLAAIFGQEYPSETVTQIGQSIGERQKDIDLGKPVGPPISWTSLKDWRKAFGEIVGPVTLNTLIFAALGKGGHIAYQNLAKEVQNRPRTDPNQLGYEDSGKGIQGPPLPPPPGLSENVDPAAPIGWDTTEVDVDGKMLPSGKPLQGAPAPVGGGRQRILDGQPSPVKPEQPVPLNGGNQTPPTETVTPTEPEAPVAPASPIPRDLEPTFDDFIKATDDFEGRIQIVREISRKSGVETDNFNDLSLEEKREAYVRAVELGEGTTGQAAEPPVETPVEPEAPVEPPVEPETPAEPEAAAEPVAPRSPPISIKDAETNKPATIEVYTGSGRKTVSEVYGPFGNEPIISGARYGAMTQRDAERYGPEVDKRTVELKNPLVLDSDDQWREMARAAGSFPKFDGMEKADIRKALDNIRADIVANGHDGIIVRLSPGSLSDDTSILRTMFGHDQVIELTAPEATAATPVEATAETPTETEAPVNEASTADQRMDGIVAKLQAWTEGKEEDKSNEFDPVTLANRLIANIERRRQDGHVFTEDDAKLAEKMSNRWTASEAESTPSEPVAEETKEAAPPPPDNVTPLGADPEIEGVIDGNRVRPYEEILQPKRKKRTTWDNWVDGLIGSKAFAGVDFPKAFFNPFTPRLRAIFDKGLTPSQSAKEVMAVLRDSKKDPEPTVKAKQTSITVPEIDAIVATAEWKEATKGRKENLEYKDPGDMSPELVLLAQGWRDGLTGNLDTSQKKALYYRGAYMSLGSWLPGRERLKNTRGKISVLKEKWDKEYKKYRGATQIKVGSKVIYRNPKRAGSETPGVVEAIDGDKAKVKLEGASRANTFNLWDLEPVEPTEPRPSTQASRTVPTAQESADERAEIGEAIDRAGEEAFGPVFDPPRVGRTEQFSNMDYRVIFDPGDIIFETDNVNMTYPQAAKAAIAQRDAKLGQLRRKGLNPQASMVGDVAIIEYRSDDSVDTVYSKGGFNPGRTYKGLILDQVEGTEEGRKGPIRRESILGELAKALDTPLYEGRVRGKGVGGFFRRHINEVRTKNPADLEVGAHEFAHLIDYLFPEIRKQWWPARPSNAKVRNELSGVSYDQDLLYEGFAEYFRRRLTMEEDPAAYAPTFHAWFEKWLDNKSNKTKKGVVIGPVVRQAEKRMKEWFGQSGEVRGASKIGAGPIINFFRDGFFDRLRQSVFDDLHGIYRMVRDLQGINNLDLNIYEIARLTRSLYSMMEGTILYGRPVIHKDGSHGFEGDSLMDVFKDVSKTKEDLEKTLRYFVGLSTKELTIQDREKLFTRAEVIGFLKLYTPERQAAYEKYQVWQEAFVDFAEAKGAIDPEFRANWRRRMYLPMYRAVEGRSTLFGDKGTPGNWQGIKALKGGTANLMPVMQNIISNATMLMKAGLLNEARVGVADLADKSEGGARYMVKIPKERAAKIINKEQIKAELLKAMGVKTEEHLSTEQTEFFDEIIDNMDPIIKLWGVKDPSGKDVVAVMRKGKPEFYEVADPILYRSMVALNRPHRDWFTQNIMGTAKRIGQGTITLTPDFIMANLFRDTLMSSVMTKYGFRPIYDSIKGLNSRVFSDQDYKDAIANGLGFSSYLVDEQAFKKNQRFWYAKRGIAEQHLLNSPAKIALAAENFADAFEMAARLGEYKRGRNAGVDRRKAAYGGREVSTDFAMRGDNSWINWMYDTVIFLKAGMNGVDRLYRGVAHDENRGRIAAKTALLGASTMALYLLNRGNPLYEEHPDVMKDLHWFFYVPNEKYFAWLAERGLEYGEAYPETAQEARSMFTQLLLPRIWEIGAIAAASERALGSLMSGVPKDIAKHWFRITAEVFRFELLPQAVKPFMEIWINENRFADFQIISDQEKRSQMDWSHAGHFTSPTMEAYGRNVGRHMPDFFFDFLKSPKLMEHLLYGYLNTWARMTLTWSDQVFFNDVAPHLRLSDLPGIRRFWKEGVPRATGVTKEFFKIAEIARKTVGTANAVGRKGETEIATEMRESTPHQYAGHAVAGSKVLANHRKEITDIKRMKTLQELRNYVAKHGRRKNAKYFSPTGARQTKIYTRSAWSELSRLKTYVIDGLLERRNQLVKDRLDQIKKIQKDREKSLSSPGQSLPTGASGQRGPRGARW